MLKPRPQVWDMYLHDLGPQPVALSIVCPHPSDKGNSTTREPTAEERARIRAWIGKFVTGQGKAPIGGFNVKGVAGTVLFRRVWQ